MFIRCFSLCTANAANKSDNATISARERHGSGPHRRRGRASRARPENDGRRSRTLSSSSLSDDNEPRRSTASSGEKVRRHDETGSDSSPPRNTTKNKNRKGQKERNQRRRTDSALDAILSSSSSGSGSDDDDSESIAASGRKAKKRQSRLQPKPAPEEIMDRTRYEAGEAVEARFGGRSKWFPGKVGRSEETRA